MKAVVTADVELSLMAYSFGVQTCIFCAVMVLATVEYVFEICIPIFLYLGYIRQIYFNFINCYIHMHFLLVHRLYVFAYYIKITNVSFIN